MSADTLDDVRSVLADLGTLNQVLPAIALVCRRLAITFKGVQEGYGPIPSALLFNGYFDGEQEGTFSVFLPCTAADVEAKFNLTRNKFQHT